jgi:hypothetical protein
MMFLKIIANKSYELPLRITEQVQAVRDKLMYQANLIPTEWDVVFEHKISIDSNFQFTGAKGSARTALSVDFGNYFYSKVSLNQHSSHPKSKIDSIVSVKLKNDTKYLSILNNDLLTKEGNPANVYITNVFNLLSNSAFLKTTTNRSFVSTGYESINLKNSVPINLIVLSKSLELFIPTPYLLKLYPDSVPDYTKFKDNLGKLNNTLTDIISFCDKPERNLTKLSTDSIDSDINSSYFKLEEAVIKGIKGIKERGDQRDLKLSEVFKPYLPVFNRIFNSIETIPLNSIRFSSNRLLAFNRLLDNSIPEIGLCNAPG